MTQKQEGVIVMVMIPALVLTAIQLGKLDHKEFIFELSSDFFAGVLISFAMVLTVIGISKLLPRADAKSG